MQHYALNGALVALLVGEAASLTLVRQAEPAHANGQEGRSSDIDGARATEVLKEKVPTDTSALARAPARTAAKRPELSAAQVGAANDANAARLLRLAEEARREDQRAAAELCRWYLEEGGELGDDEHEHAHVEDQLERSHGAHEENELEGEEDGDGEGEEYDEDCVEEDEEEGEEDEEEE